MGDRFHHDKLYICRMCDEEFWASWSKLELCKKCRPEYFKEQTREWHELQQLQKHNRDVDYRHRILPWRLLRDPTGDFIKGARFSLMEIRYGLQQHVFALGTRFKSRKGKQFTVQGRDHEWTYII